MSATDEREFFAAVGLEVGDTQPCEHSWIDLDDREQWCRRLPTKRFTVMFGGNAIHVYMCADHELFHEGDEE